jgi:hypothetical protein
MKLSALAAGAGLTAAFAMPATGVSASPADPIGHRGLGVTIVSASNVAGTRDTRVKKPKVAARPKASRTAARPLLLFGRAPVATAVETGIGGADNCAAYTGCSNEEYCIIWGLRCELVPPPVGTRPMREAPVS